MKPLILPHSPLAQHLKDPSSPNGSKKFCLKKIQKPNTQLGAFRLEVDFSTVLNHGGIVSKDWLKAHYPPQCFNAPFTVCPEGIKVSFYYHSKEKAVFARESIQTATWFNYGLRLPCVLNLH